MGSLWVGRSASSAPRRPPPRPLHSGRGDKEGSSGRATSRGMARGMRQSACTRRGGVLHFGPSRARPYKLPWRRRRAGAEANSALPRGLGPGLSRSVRHRAHPRKHGEGGGRGRGFRAGCSANARLAGPGFSRRHPEPRAAGDRGNPPQGPDRSASGPAVAKQFTPQSTSPGPRARPPNAGSEPTPGRKPPPPPGGQRPVPPPRPAIQRALLGVPRPDLSTPLRSAQDDKGREDSGRASPAPSDTEPIPGSTGRGEGGGGGSEPGARRTPALPDPGSADGTRSHERPEIEATRRKARIDRLAVRRSPSNSRPRAPRPAPVHARRMRALSRHPGGSPRPLPGGQNLGPPPNPRW